MTRSELEAAGWTFESQPGTPGIYTRGIYKIEYRYNSELRLLAQLRWWGFVLKGPVPSAESGSSLNELGKVLMPDGRTVREFALNPEEVKS